MDFTAVPIIEVRVANSKFNIGKKGSPCCKTPLWRRKKVTVGSWIDITFPGVAGVWHIQIIPYYYESRPAYTTGKRFDNRIEDSVNRLPRKMEDEGDNKIAADAPLAKALVGKAEGERYSYQVREETFSGEIIKIYQ